MRIVNAAASLNTPLVYPAGHVGGGVLPITKQEALNMTGNV
jgi:hypothetical protein